MNQHRANLHTDVGTVSSTAVRRPKTFTVLAALITVGVAYAFARQVMHVPLQLPGHNGLHWIALLVAARLLADRPWAASAVAAGTAVASALPLLGFHEALSGWHYLLTGAVLDGLFVVFHAACRQPWILAGIAAVAFMIKPVSKFVLGGAFGLHYGSLEHGLLYPLGTHLAFGFAGAMIGVSAVMLAHRVLQRGAR